MLRVISHTSAAGAIAYFESALKNGDYYLDQECHPSTWEGRGAQLLDLGTDVTSEQFAALVNNRHPGTGEKLTQRDRDGRIVAYELNFNSVKSLSLLHAMTGDERLVHAFRDAVSETMAEIEKLAATRVRVDGQQSDRVVGNLVWANFIHATTRPVNGIPDPHLHCHNYTINAVYDSVEGKWKAGKFHEIKKQAPLHEAAFHARLAKKLTDLGYSIRRTRRAWEVVGISDTLIELFSRRTAEIEAFAEKHGITDSKIKDALGAITRSGKCEGMSNAELLAAWMAMMHPDELDSIYRTHSEKPTMANAARISAKDALDFAEAKVFQHDSVVRRTRLLMEALRYGVGHCLPEEIDKEFERRGYIQRHVDGDDLVTTHKLVCEEADLICRVRETRNQCAPIHPGRIRIGLTGLSFSQEQKSAVRQIMKSTDEVIALRGLAGAGKTTALREVREQVQKLGRQFYAFAPTNRASKHVLREDGFEDADTVAKLLSDRKLQEEIRQNKGSVILIDEAGTLGIRDLMRVMEIAGGNSRVILAGDVFQHAPVARGDALRLIERYSGTDIITLSTIKRQRVSDYREAVVELAAGRISEGFAILDKLEAFEEIVDDESRYRQMAAEWLQRLKEDGAPPLVISPTHAEGREATAAIRDALREAGKLGTERRYLQYRQVRLTDADKTRPEVYAAGMVVKANQNMKGVKRGSMLNVIGVDESQTVWVGMNEKSKFPLDLKRAKDFELFEVGEISLAKGDLVKLTTNGKSVNGKRLYNGMIHKISHISRDGTLTLENGASLPPHHGHFEHGYCQTSHVSQGTTSSAIFLVQSSASAGAASQQQIYVSISRGEYVVRVFTDDREALLEAVGCSSSRMSALELSGVGEELFMAGLTGEQWAERLAQYRMERHNGSHVQKLAANRKVDPLAKPAEMPFSAYIDMRRANVTADGKSRSKGMPTPERREGFKGMTDPRRVEMRDGLVDRNKAMAEAREKGVERKPTDREKRIGKVMEAVKENFREVMERGKQRVAAVAESANRFIRIGHTKIKASQFNSEAAQKANVQRQARIERQPEPPKKAPAPAPVIRRGK